MELSNGLLIDAFYSIRDVVNETVNGLSVADLGFQPTESANSIAWLVWHLTRIQDDHISGLSSKAQVWVKDWYERFNLPFEKNDTGYGHSLEDVARVRSEANLLTNYFNAVNTETIKYIETLDKQDYEKVVDNRWDPPVTQAVRLISIVSDDLQHAGQAAYVRGLLSKRQ